MPEQNDENLVRMMAEPFGEPRPCWIVGWTSYIRGDMVPIQATALGRLYPSVGFVVRLPCGSPITVFDIFDDEASVWRHIELQERRGRFVEEAGGDEDGERVDLIDLPVGTRVDLGHGLVTEIYENTGHTGRMRPVVDAPEWQYLAGEEMTIIRGAAEVSASRVIG